MENLAGNLGCDAVIQQELAQAGIKIIQHTQRVQNEVPASITGELGDFTFTRAWYYWVVVGDVPLAVAQKMYKDPVGKQDVRVIGHCGCPAPDGWIEIHEGKPVITHYHIDTQKGLNLFVRTMKKHKVV